MPHAEPKACGCADAATTKVPYNTSQLKAPTRCHRITQNSADQPPSQNQQHLARRLLGPPLAQVKQHRQLKGLQPSTSVVGTGCLRSRIFLANTLVEYNAEEAPNRERPSAKHAAPASVSEPA